MDSYVIWKEISGGPLIKNQTIYRENSQNMTVKAKNTKKNRIKNNSSIINSNLLSMDKDEINERTFKFGGLKIRYVVYSDIG